MVEAMAVAWLLVGLFSVVAAAASMERTAAAMSQWAARMRDKRRDVKDFEVSFTWFIVASKRSGAGAAATVTSN